MNWFDVDKEGLAKLLAKRGKAFVVFELIQNCWDQEITRVDITLEPVPNRPLAKLVVEDDDPNGFANLADAYTLFAESNKKGDPEKRGRFNLGEKLVLALCKEATISTTSGTVIFDGKGRRRIGKKLDRGSRFSGLIKMTRAEWETACEAATTLLPPEGITTTFNDAPLKPRQPIHTFEATLPTELADADGNLRRSSRKTTVRIYAPCENETASLYEMGLPVVETGDKFHYDVGQKVPLNMDRDNVTPAFLRQVRTVVFNKIHQHIDPDEANDEWARQALSDERVSDEAVQDAIAKRFGEKCVSYDPSDPEANKLAMSKGYTVVHGGMLSKEEWSNVRRAEGIRPAGQVTPSPKPYSDDPTAPREELLPENEWTEGICLVVDYAKALAAELLGIRLAVRVTNDINVPAEAAYCRRSKNSGDLMFNLQRLGHGWFEEGITEKVNGLLIHEFGHHYSGDHLSSGYHEALCRLGAKLASLALEKPEFFESGSYGELPATAA